MLFQTALRGLGRSWGLVFSVLLMVSLAVRASGSEGTLTLTPYPALGVADGRSTVTITAELRQSNGQLVPDGTQVLFDATLGTFRENSLSTVNGIVKGVLVAPSIVGISRITASAFSVNARATLELEFVDNRALLSSAMDYIEVLSDRYLMYSPESRILAAAGPDKGAKLRYRDIEIEADDLQLVVTNYTVRARRARLKLGKEVRDYDELNFVLNQRRGFGVTTYEGAIAKVYPYGRAFRVETEKRVRRGVVEIRSDGIAGYEKALIPGTFDLADLNESMTLIGSRKAVAFPHKEVQFHSASVYVDGNRVLRVPLYQISTNSSTPVLTDQFFNVTSNQLAINYPYYLSLKPGETSLLRFRAGTRYSSGVGAGRGVFLDYELRWNRGESMDGGFGLQGLGRSDWGVTTRQYWRFNDSTTLSVQLDFPANSSLFGNISLTRPFPGLQLAYNGNWGRSVRGSRFQNDQHYLTLEKDPIKVGKLPVRLFYGITGSTSNYVTASSRSSQSAFGITARARTLPLRLDRRSTLSASLRVGQLSGHNARDGLTISSTTTVSSSLNPSTTAVLTYDYLNDGFNAQYIGRHRVSSQLSWYRGAVSFSTFATKSLDIDRLNGYADLSYRFGPLWRLGSYFSLDRYRGSTFEDLSVVASYRLGVRDIGLSWSQRTKRLGIEIMGAGY